MTRTKKLFSGSMLLGCGCLAGGCDPPPPMPQELGRIVFNEAEMPGVNQVYVLPDYLRETKPEETEEGPPPAE